MLNIKAISGMSHVKLVFILTMFLLFGGMATDIYIPSLPKMTTQLGSNVEAGSLTISMYILFSALGGLFAGMLGDRFGRRRMLLFSAMLYIISSIAIAFAFDMTLIIIFRMFQGVAAGIAMIVTRQVTKDLYTEKEQININSIMFTAYVVSPAIAPVVGAFIAHLFSWRACFIFIAVAMFLLFLEVKRHLKETAKEKKPLPHPVTYMGTFPAFFMTKDFNACVLISSLVFAAYFAFITISSFIFLEHYHFSPNMFSLIFAALAAVYLLGNQIMKIFINRDMSKAKIILYGCIFNFIGGVIMIISVSRVSPTLGAIALIISAIFMRFGLGFMLALIQIVAMNKFKKNGAQALGTLLFVQSVAASLAAIWVSSFTDHILGLFVVCIIFNTLALLLHIWLLEGHTHFPNLKYKFLKKSIVSPKTSKFLELKHFKDGHHLQHHKKQK